VQPACVICSGAVDASQARHGELRCRRCLESPPAFRRVYAIACYRSAAEDEPGSLPALIRRHKYGFDQALSRALIEYLPASLPVVREDYDIVVPVPLHRRRLWQRGFNQSAILASEIARRLKVELEVSGLARIRFTKPQTARDHAERQRNVRDAFFATPNRVKGRRVLLVDDVVTTGATVNECATALLEGGARAVDVFALARVP